MKFSVLVAVMTAGVSSAFAPTPTTTSLPSQLSLFGGGSKDGDAKPGGGMMDQLAMFKKAQEMAKKKQKLDQELSSETFKGVAADGKVEASCKFVPSKNPMDPQPDYQAAGFDFDAEWYDSASPEDLSTAVKDALMNAIDVTNEAVKEKYMLLEEDIKNLQGQ